MKYKRVICERCEKSVKLSDEKKHDSAHLMADELRIKIMSTITVKDLKNLFPFEVFFNYKIDDKKDTDGFFNNSIFIINRYNEESSIDDYFSNIDRLDVNNFYDIAFSPYLTIEIPLAKMHKDFEISSIVTDYEKDNKWLKTNEILTKFTIIEKRYKKECNKIEKMLEKEINRVITKNECPIEILQTDTYIHCDFNEGKLLGNSIVVKHMLTNELIEIQSNLNKIYSIYQKYKEDRNSIIMKHEEMKKILRCKVLKVIRRECE